MRPETDAAGQRERALHRWYRERLQGSDPAAAGEMAGRSWACRRPASGIKKMKTKWGTCNIEARRIWLNLELAKKPPMCLEYLIVHELVHLIERNHNDRFVALMDRHLPNWRQHRQELNAAPLAHETWGY